MNERNWLESVCGSVRWRGDQGSCHCPLPTHGSKDRKPSFSVNAAKGTFFCHKEGIGGGLQQLSQLTGRQLPDDESVRQPSGNFDGRISAMYDYVDEGGQLCYQVVRLVPKDFRLRRPNPKRPGFWIWNLGGCNPLPYRLPALLTGIAAGEQVFVVEGEKDADALTAQVRVALGRSIIQQLYPSGAEMQVMSLDPQLERVLLQAIAGGGDNASIEPSLAETLIRETSAAAQRQEELGLPAVLLVSGNLRLLLSRFLRRGISQLKVLAHGEVPESKIIKVTSIIGGRA